MIPGNKPGSWERGELTPTGSFSAGLVPFRGLRGVLALLGGERRQGAGTGTGQRENNRENGN